MLKGREAARNSNSQYISDYNLILHVGNRELWGQHYPQTQPQHHCQKREEKNQFSQAKSGPSKVWAILLLKFRLNTCTITRQPNETVRFQKTKPSESKSSKCKLVDSNRINFIFILKIKLSLNYQGTNSEIAVTRRIILKVLCFNIFNVPKIVQLHYLRSDQ